MLVKEASGIYILALLQWCHNCWDNLRTIGEGYTGVLNTFGFQWSSSNLFQWADYEIDWYHLESIITTVLASRGSLSINVALSFTYKPRVAGKYRIQIYRKINTIISFTFLSDDSLDNGELRSHYIMNIWQVLSIWTCKLSCCSNFTFIVYH